MTNTATETIRVRVEPELKHEAEKILKELGLSASEAIRMYYQQIRMLRGIPFDIRIPNAITLEAMRDAEKRQNLESFDSHEEAFKALGI